MYKHFYSKIKPNCRHSYIHTCIHTYIYTHKPDHQSITVWWPHTLTIIRWVRWSCSDVSSLFKLYESGFTRLKYCGFQNLITNCNCYFLSHHSLHWLYIYINYHPLKQLLIHCRIKTFASVLCLSLTDVTAIHSALVDTHNFISALSCTILGLPLLYFGCLPVISSMHTGKTKITLATQILLKVMTDWKWAEIK